MSKLFLSLGSNIGNRAMFLSKALLEIEQRLGDIIKVSSFIESIPWGYDSSNKYLNAVVLVETKYFPIDILDIILSIEVKLGRKRDKSINSYQDRTIDIDILLIDDLVINTDILTIPHPLMNLRSFVLEPLVEIAPSLLDPITNISFKEYLNKTKKPI